MGYGGFHRCLYEPILWGCFFQGMKKMNFYSVKFRSRSGNRDLFRRIRGYNDLKILNSVKLLRCKFKNKFGICN